MSFISVFSKSSFNSSPITKSIISLPSSVTVWFSEVDF
jgi:hypothetical protein